MRFTAAPLAGVFVIDVEKREDPRGFFARTYCEREFSAQGIHRSPVQSNISFNELRGTVRGMHYQRAPHAEAKLVRCTAGRIFDVIVDLRESSPTLYQWFGVELDSVTRRAVYIPEGFAHGFQTLEDSTEVFYQMFDYFQPGYADGIRWNDPAIGIEWPLDTIVISEKDCAYPLVDVKP